MRINKYGPFTFGYNDDSIIASASLVDASNLGSFAVTGTGSATYNAGIYLPAGASLVYQPSAADRALLFKGGTLRFLLECTDGGFPLDIALGAGHATNRDICGWDDGSTDDFFLRVNGVGTVIPNHNGNLSADYSELRTFGGFNEIILSWGHGSIDFYLNGTFIRNITLPAGRDSAEFTNICLGSNRVTTGNSLTTHRYRDVYITTNHIQRSARPFLTHVNIYGDSFVKLGQYGNDSNESDLTSRIEDGQSGGTFDASDYHNAGLVPVLHGALLQGGLFIGRNRIHAWHQGATGINTTPSLGDRVDVSLNGAYPYPTLSIIHIGTNDVTGSTSSADFSDGTWQASFQAEIDKLLAVGSKIVLCTLPPAEAETLYDTAQNRTDEDNANAALKAIANANSNIYLCDTFTALGGHDFNPIYFGTFTGASDDRHPSKQGHRIIGETIAKTILQIIE